MQKGTKSVHLRGIRSKRKNGNLDSIDYVWIFCVFGEFCGFENFSGFKAEKICGVGEMWSTAGNF
jgi:hypothetical protein